MKFMTAISCSFAVTKLSRDVDRVFTCCIKVRLRILMSHQIHSHFWWIDLQDWRWSYLIWFALTNQIQSSLSICLFVSLATVVLIVIKLGHDWARRVDGNTLFALQMQVLFPSPWICTFHCGWPSFEFTHLTAVCAVHHFALGIRD
jgi:hypothetical protein